MVSSPELIPARRPPAFAIAHPRVGPLPPGAPQAEQRGLPPGPRSGRPGRAHPGLRLAAVVLLALSLLGIAGAGVALAVTPDVQDAPARVAALAAQHNTTPADPAADPAAGVPGRFAAALVATEDARFYTHHGVDSIGILRAAATAVGGVEGDAGGSTLDQQLATELYTDGQRGGPLRGAEQLTLGVKLDARYSKQHILAMYASTVYFGHGFYGLDAASRRYFGTAPDRLGWAQAALLAGLVQAPSADDPYRHPDVALARQRHVLTRLVDTGTLTAAQADAARPHAAAPALVDTPPLRGGGPVG